MTCVGGASSRATGGRIARGRPAARRASRPSKPKSRPLWSPWRPGADDQGDHCATSIAGEPDLSVGAIGHEALFVLIASGSDEDVGPPASCEDADLSFEGLDEFAPFQTDEDESSKCSGRVCNPMSHYSDSIGEKVVS